VIFPPRGTESSTVMEFPWENDGKMLENPWKMMDFFHGKMLEDAGF